MPGRQHYYESYRAPIHLKLCYGTQQYSWSPDSPGVLGGGSSGCAFEGTRAFALRTVAQNFLRAPVSLFAEPIKYVLIYKNNASP